MSEAITNIKTIRVTGKGQIRIKPDMTRITLTLEGICPEYAKAMAENAGYNLDIEPDDIEASETVTVLWAIG